VQELEPSWKLVLATVIGFFGSACGTVGGVGGGGIFVPMLNLLLGFDTKSAAALSKCNNNNNNNNVFFIVEVELGISGFITFTHTDTPWYRCV